MDRKESKDNTVEIKYENGTTSVVSHQDFLELDYTEMQSIVVHGKMTLTDPIGMFEDSKIETIKGNLTLVGNVSSMFKNAENYNQLMNWVTTEVTDMSNMLRGASSFNKNLNWNTENVTNMSGLFRDAISYDLPVNLNTSNVTNMSHMFHGAKSFNRLLHLITTNVTNMSHMFHGALSYNNYPKTSGLDEKEADRVLRPLRLDTKNVTNMNSMFQGAVSFNQPLHFNTSNVQHMDDMFEDAPSFDQVLTFDQSKVIPKALSSASKVRPSSSSKVISSKKLESRTKQSLVEESWFGVKKFMSMIEETKQPRCAYKASSGIHKNKVCGSTKVVYYGDDEHNPKWPNASDRCSKCINSKGEIKEGDLYAMEELYLTLESSWEEE
jgi:hypothetical protein